MATPVLVERIPLSRPYRLGTRRRAPRKAERGSTVGASSAAERRAPSLDTDKHLATTVAEWSKALETPRDTYRDKLKLHSVVCSTVHEIWQQKARAGDFDGAANWEKQWLRLSQCQSQWIGYRPECCGGKGVAVPIGCNHRLCPLCAWHRSDNARKRVRKMFDRLTHPVLITLTVPNIPTIRKHDYTLFRQRVRKLLKQHEAWIVGGVYSLETTYNRELRTWHIHAHILADVSIPLPTKGEKVFRDSQGRWNPLTTQRATEAKNCLQVGAFQFRKQSLEFDWLRLWSPTWGRKQRSDASAMRRAGDAYHFNSWLDGVRAHSTRVYNRELRRFVKRTDLSEAEMLRREQWNRENRRVIDLKPVTNREGAAFEVLKYITKVSEFSDRPEAVEPFIDAVKGARLIQTFGTWYGVDLSGDANDLDWSQMKCECGCNDWTRIGVFYRHQVQMDEAGRWMLRNGLEHFDMGTVTKPKIPHLQQLQGSSEFAFGANAAGMQ